ncbi:MAG: phosphotransferase [Candidatus Levyibacteriota bacterium]
MDEFQKRINYQGDLKPLFSKVCKDYNIGSYESHELIIQGYEDFNLILITDKGKFFVKIFGSFRSEKECRQYIEVVNAALSAGVSHPKLYKNHDDFLYKTSLAETEDRLSVFEYIGGNSFFELNHNPTNKELQFIIKQAVLINSIQLKPPLIYDSWAIINFLKEYREKGKVLESEQKLLINPLVADFEGINFNKLPKALIHGDLITTNLMKDKNGKIYVIDFAVANYSPRIIELAVLFNDTFFDKGDISQTKDYYNLALVEYQKYITLTEYELETLPILVKVGHAMHLLRATYEKVINHNNSKENEYFLNLGKVGLTSGLEN